MSDGEAGALTQTTGVNVNGRGVAVGTRVGDAVGVSVGGGGCGDAVAIITAGVEGSAVEVAVTTIAG
jgi:hypothetical protein